LRQTRSAERENEELSQAMEHEMRHCRISPAEAEAILSRELFHALSKGQPPIFPRISTT
jgi:hypothetical protein